MKHNHYLMRLTSGVLICTTCTMIFKETIEGLKSVDHLSKEPINVIHYPLADYIGTASGVNGTITFTLPLTNRT